MTPGQDTDRRLEHGEAQRRDVTALGCPPPSFRRVHLAVALAVVLCVTGCAEFKQTVGGWFGAATPAPTPAPTPGPQAKAAGPRVYYAGEALKVYSTPSASSKVVGELGLHEKVTRFKLERGFAYVESATSDVKGWVVNAQLIWRLPSGATTAAPAPSEAEPEAPAAEEPQAPPEPEATAPAVEAPTAIPTNTPAAAPPNPTATPRGAAPSIFDAY